jgi:hypothetical protein
MVMATSRTFGINGYATPKPRLHGCLDDPTAQLAAVKIVKINTALAEGHASAACA